MGYDYYIGLYFWRINRDTDKVGVYTRGENEFYWDEDESFQGMKNIRFANWMRHVSKETLLKEAAINPPQVKDANTMRMKEVLGI
jgi:hypothetical protein